MYSRFSAVVRFSEPPLGTQFRALVGQPCAPTLQSWLRIPGVDRQPGRLRLRRRLHTSQPRRGSVSFFKLRKFNGLFPGLTVWALRFDTRCSRSGLLHRRPGHARLVCRDRIPLNFLQAAMAADRHDLVSGTARLGQSPACSFAKPVRAQSVR